MATVPVRQVRQKHSDDKTVTKKITIRGSLLARTLEQAAKEGHHNLSLQISRALNVYLNLYPAMPAATKEDTDDRAA